MLHSSSQSLTRGVVGRVLGPTYSGDGTSLVYPGIKFEVTSHAPGSAGKRDDKVESLTVTTKDESGALPEITPLHSVTILVSHIFTTTNFMSGQLEVIADRLAKPRCDHMYPTRGLGHHRGDYRAGPPTGPRSAVAQIRQRGRSDGTNLGQCTA